MLLPKQPTTQILCWLRSGEDKPEAQAAKSMEEFAKQHPLFAVLQINQYNGQLAPGPVVGIADKKDIAKINEYLNMKQVKRYPAA